MLTILNINAVFQIMHMLKLKYSKTQAIATSYIHQQYYPLKLSYQSVASHN